jgi:lysophospholipase L1-like esterase
VPFGVNEVRLTARQWLAAFALVALVAGLTPLLWARVERFQTGPDYRIPYSLSKDYWLYARRLHQTDAPDKIWLLGDSVVWGEYVAPDGTLSHFLNHQAGTADRFVNGGLNGLFPLAQEGLLRYYGRTLRHRNLLLQCNVLWLTSPKADLSSTKEEPFNHARLVPQFRPRIPCYRADANQRLSAVIERHVPFIGWVDHLQDAYFGQKSILSWTLQDDGGSPPSYTNAWKDPLAQITFSVPCAPQPDPDRGPSSRRHRKWSDTTQITRFEWVDLDASLQWRAFQRLLDLLRQRDNQVFVVLGPFNEHMIAEDNRPPFRHIRDGIAAWLTQNHVDHLVPETLPSELYADASHPLTDGYRLLARRLYQDPTFKRWLDHPPHQ